MVLLFVSFAALWLLLAMSRVFYLCLCQTLSQGETHGLDGYRCTRSMFSFGKISIKRIPGPAIRGSPWYNINIRKVLPWTYFIHSHLATLSLTARSTGS